MEVERGPGGEPVKWRLLGFETEDVTEEFHDVGMLGLDCLVCCFLLLLHVTECKGAANDYVCAEGLGS
jgi:hypothetical protein